jgi:hypothetical protein
VKDWLRGAAWILVPLFLWMLLLSNPRLGALRGMSQNQPEVGLRLEGFFARYRAWLDLAKDALPWTPAAASAVLLGPLLGLWLWWRARDAQARALALLPWVPALALGVFALLNMRSFDRYALVYLAPLCAAPALLASGFVVGSRGRRLAAALSLALGLAAFWTARNQPLSPEQQGAAGDHFDGYRSALLDVQALEPGGAALFSEAGGLRWLGAWYLGPGWKLRESASEMVEDEAPYAIGRQDAALPSVLPTGWQWRPLKVYDSQGRPPYFVLYRADHD